MDKRKLPTFIVLMILTLITILFWISFSIYQVFTNNGPVVVPEEIIRPIDASLDLQTVATMKDKIYIEQ